MLENACSDPLEIPCRDCRLILVEDGPLPEVTPGSLVSWPQRRPPPALPAGVALEIRTRGELSFYPQERDWSLYLDCLDPFDLGRIEEVLEAAQAAGCHWVVAAGLTTRWEGAQDYRYRLYSLIRLLCDRLKLKFSIYETQPLEAHERLNHYLASRRGCCRFPVIRSGP